MRLILPRTIVMVAMFIIMLATFGVRAEALSTQWSSGLPNLCGVGTNSCPQGSGWVSFFGVQATVAYNARVVSMETGEVIACGSTISGDVPVRYEFIPHIFSDITWFASGRGFDSPYGDWTMDGVAPTGNKCDGKYSIGRTGGGAGYGTAFGSLAVNPPPKTITGLLPGACTTATDGVSQECTFTEGGDVNAVFHFGDTFGYMYSALRPEGGKKLEARYRNQCLGYVIMGTNAGASYRVPVPEQTISCGIKYIIPSDPKNGAPPTAPILNAVAACLVGQPHAITMVSTDPDNNNLRYGVDWNEDGSIDQFVPPSGYVPSGTIQSASRTYSTPGAKTVKIIAHDEGGLRSNWATYSFSCAETPAMVVVQCADGLDNDGDGETDLNDPECSSASGTSEFSGLPPLPPPPVSIPSADLRLTVPSLVGRGKTVQVIWSADNVKSCLPVVGTNGDSFKHFHVSNTFYSPVGGKTSAPIKVRTTYRLTCIDLNGITRSKEATVNIQPNFRER